jgi:undecaprenyl diphosphate synthase
VTAIPPASLSSVDLEIEKKQLTFSPEEIALLDSDKIPKHIAIIMDGNRRWARSEKLQAIAGHWEGAELLTEIVRASAELGVETLTVFGFSTENWSRPGNEIESLMDLFEFYLIQKREMMARDGIRFNVIGDESGLPSKIQEAIRQTRKATEGCSRINLVLAINYGGRDEIRRTVAKILARHEERKINTQELTEEFIGNFLDTSRWGDPDLLIRTGGEMRISNFLLWQISYSELYITDKFWPDFTPKELLQALLEYQSRQRRVGR